MAKQLLTKKFIRWFETEQKEHGTDTALYNLVWLLSADAFKRIGVKRVSAK